MRAERELLQDAYDFPRCASPSHFAGWSFGRNNSKGQWVYLMKGLFQLYYNFGRKAR